SIGAVHRCARLPVNHRRLVRDGVRCRRARSRLLCYAGRQPGAGGLPVLQLHPARVSARRVPPRRVALIMALFVALLLSGLALARPGAGPDPVGAAMPATQSARSFPWLWGAFQVLGVMPLAPAGSTQSWRLELPPASEVTLANSPLTVVPVRWNGPAADCRPVAGGISCHNTSAQ